MPIAKKNIPQDFLDQMKTNLKKEDSVEIEETPVQDAPLEKQQEYSVESSINKSTVQIKPEESKKDKYADVMNIRLQKGRRNEIKAFCTNCGITVTQYIETSFDYLYKEVAAGRLVISKGGITKIED